MSRRSPRGSVGALADVAWVLAVFAVLGVAGAFVWEAVVELPTFERTAQGGQMGQAQLSGLVGIDGWFFVVGGVAGLVAGAALMLWRSARPLLLVVALLAGSVLASWLMLRVGLRLGPPDPGPILQQAQVGDRVPVRLDPKAGGVAYVWPFATLVGALVVLLLVTPREDEPTPAAVDRPVDQPVDQPVDRHVDRPVDRAMDRPPDR